MAAERPSDPHAATADLCISGRPHEWRKGRCVRCNVEQPRHHDTAAATGRPVTPTGPHRDDVLLGKVMRVRARIDLVARTNATSSFETELRLLDEVIEELTLDDD